MMPYFQKKMRKTCFRNCQLQERWGLMKTHCFANFKYIIDIGPPPTEGWVIFVEH